MNKIANFWGEDGFGTYEVTFGKMLSTQRVNGTADTWIIPGFVDIHFHGISGMDTMTASPCDFEAMCSKLTREGYEAFLPTTITAQAEDVNQALSNLPENNPMIPGFHLEGPFINPEFIGAQPVLNPAPVPINPEWRSVLEHPMLKVVTLAPEMPHNLDLILELNRRDVISSMGHSAATYEEARRGFEFGVTHVTHMFNALRPFHHREAGAVGYALMNDSLTCELIYDRKHVCKESASLLYKMKGEDKIIAVSDSTAATRLAPGQKLNMWGHDVVVDNDCVRLASNNAFAGSTITLLDAFRNIFEDFGPAAAIKACCLNPRKALKMTEPPRVYIHFDKDLEILAIYQRNSPWEAI